MRKWLAAFAIIIATLGIASPAYARGGFSGGGGSVSHSFSGGSSSHTSSGGGSISHSSTHISSGGSKAPSSSGTKAPSTKTQSGSGHSITGGSAKTGKSTTAPKSSGVKAPTVTHKSTTISKNPTTGKVSVSRSTRVSGSSYNLDGHTYTYSSTRSYYHSYPGGGYAPLGTALYWTMLNDPYYYYNYANPASSWYGMGYPSGYSVQNGQLVASQQHSSSLAWLWILLIILVVIAIALSIWAIFFRSRKADPMIGSKF